jgi:CheY-like chemotaxis protein
LENSSRSSESDGIITDKRILIVDDQPYNTEALKILIGAILKRDASEVCSVAYNGKEATEIVRKCLDLSTNGECCFKLILMDCNMPVMDGYEATR